MSGDSLIVQKIEKKCATDVDKAVRYYSVLFCLNNIHLSIKQIELLAFISVKGNIAYPKKEEFIEMFDSSFASLENIKSKLMKRGFLVKQKSKIQIHPALRLDFTENLIIEIKLCKQDDRVTSESTDTVREVEQGVVQESVEFD